MSRRGASTLSAYGSFLACSARTGSTSGTRASGRFDTFAQPPLNDCYLREGDG